MLATKEEKMAEVIIERKEDFEKALKKFKRQCQREGILKEYRERQYYTKPSQKRRRKNVKRKKKS
jgi:small subunit ribosomal protein S21